MMAKLNVQVTDIGYAQIVEHLGRVWSIFNKLQSISSQQNINCISQEIVSQ